jgi:putative hydrolase
MSDNPNESPFSGLPFFGDMAKAMFSQGPLQWDVARQTAMMTALSGASSEPNVDPAARVGIEQLVPIADLHVRNHTGLDTVTAGKDPRVVVVNRSMWVHHTLESYKPLFTELAQSLSATPATSSTEIDSLQDDPMANMMASLNKMMAPAMMGMSVGTMVGQLALRTFGQYDLPLPREPRDQILIVISNVDEFASDWSLATDDMRMWVLIHELTSHAVLTSPHIREALSAALSSYIAAFSPNPHALMDRLTNMDLGTGDPMAMMQKFLTDPTIILGAVRSTSQETQAPALDAKVAAIIGYIDHAVDAVSASLLGGSSQISEAVRRRRVEASPSDTFVEQLLGLRLTRDQVQRGHAFAAGVVERAGQSGLSALFASPDNLPTPSELDAPGLWLARLNIEQRDIGD